MSSYCDQVVVEVSDTLWDVVHELASCISHGPLMTGLKEQTVGLRPMVTEETIALPHGYFRLWRDADGTDPAEHVFDSIEAMLDGILAMYDDSACVMQESPQQRRRRMMLRKATNTCVGDAVGS